MQSDAVIVEAGAKPEEVNHSWDWSKMTPEQVRLANVFKKARRTRMNADDQVIQYQRRRDDARKKELEAIRLCRLVGLVINEEA